MNLVLIESMDRMIDAECKANCEACQVNSDSQFDHCKRSNCLDEVRGPESTFEHYIW